MVIKINRNKLIPSSKNAKLVFVVLYWYVFCAIASGFFGAPKAIVYFGDILNIWLLVKAMQAYKNGRNKYKSNAIFGFMIVFAITGLVSSLINLESPLLILWGIRQNFRFFVFFFSCVMFLREKDIEILLKSIGILFWISVPLATYEALFVSYPRGEIVGDYVGGIYYGISGVNAALNVLLIVYITHILLNYFEGKTKFLHMLLTVGAALYMSSLAELKIFLVEIVIILLLIMIQKRMSWKSILVCILGVGALSVAVMLFVQFNGTGRSYYTADYLSISGIIENAFRDSGYDGVNDLNRFFAVPILINRFFEKDIVGILFGLGLGNADYSLSFEGLQSAFYKQYSWLHYQWFSISFVFIETGLVGLISYIMIFVSALKVGRKYIEKKSHYGIFYSTMIVMMLIMIVYNPGLRTEQCGFILYFILAMPFAIDRTRRENMGIEYNQFLEVK